MAKTKDCIHVSCDRCGHSEFFTTILYAENIGWTFDVNIDEGNFDLCPKCNLEWDKLVHNFLYNRKEEDKNSIAISKALDVAYSYGQTDGAHHKAWVIDQMVRRLLGDGYDEWIKKYKHDEETGDEYDWDEGIAP